MNPIEYAGGGKVATFEGMRYIRDERTGYYLNSVHSIRLHRAVWIAEHGEIPNGWQVHHVDGDKSHNGIENLALLPRKEHLSLHMSAPERREFARANIVHAIEAAREWHGTPEGHEWHKKHYEETGTAMYVVRDYECEYCGKPFKSTAVRSRFCSNNCKASFRRLSGVDDIARTCPECGKEFRVNKYSARRYCSRDCGAQWRTRNGKIRTRQEGNIIGRSASL